MYVLVPSILLFVLIFHLLFLSPLPTLFIPLLLLFFLLPLLFPSPFLLVFTLLQFFPFLLFFIPPVPFSSFSASCLTILLLFFFLLLSSSSCCVFFSLLPFSPSYCSCFILFCSLFSSYFLPTGSLPAAFRPPPSARSFPLPPVLPAYSSFSSCCFSSTRSPRAPRHVVGMLWLMVSDISQPSLPTPFDSVLVSISDFMAPAMGSCGCKN